MKFLINLLLVILLVGVSERPGQTAAAEPGVETGNIIPAEAAYDLVWQALDILGKNPVKRIVITGEDVVNNEDVVLLSAGNDSPDGSKYTALYHFAVSAGGRVYYMDPVKGSEWVLLKNISVHDNDMECVQQGMYARTDSTEMRSGVLSLKDISADTFLFELKLYDRGTSLLISGVINVENNTAVFDAAALEAGAYKLKFVFSSSGQSVKITPEGKMALSPAGGYILVNKRIEVKAASAIILLGELPAAVTSLNRYNRPYEMYQVEDEADSLPGRMIIAARDIKNDTIFARFSVAEDLSVIYRIDADMKEPVCIYGVDKK